MTEFMTTALDPYAFQVDKHRAGLQSVAEGFASAPVSLPVDVHELFHRYLTASDTVVVPRMLFLQMYFDLNRAWEATGRDVSKSGHGEFYKTFMGVVGRILDMPAPFCDAGLSRQQQTHIPFNGGATDG